MLNHLEIYNMEVNRTEKYSVGETITLANGKESKIVEILDVCNLLIVSPGADSEGEELVDLEEYDPKYIDKIPTNFDTENIFQLIKLYDQFDDYCHNIFQFIKENYPQLLDDFRKPTYECYDVVDHRNIAIRYYDNGYDLYECNNFIIPTEQIHKNTVEEYIRHQYQEKFQARYEKELQAQKRMEEQERLEYERLKAKFGDE